MDDGTPTLEVGFAIETGGSFDELRQLQDLMNSTEVRVVAEAAKIEKATSGMVKLAGASTAITAFGNAATRELQNVARESARVEKSGEALVRQLERQNAAFGKTREEMRMMRAEEQALAAERVGNTDLANRIRSAEAALFDQEFAAQRRARQEAEAAAEAKTIAAAQAVAAADREAVAVREAADAYRLFEAVAKQRMGAFRAQEAEAASAATQREALAVRKAADEHARLAAMVRGSHDAQMADAAAAERLRETTDPLYAAVKRLNGEIAESTRLYHAGATAPAEYARQQEVLSGRVRAVTAAHQDMAGKMRGGASSLTQFSFQLNDIATMASLGAKPMQIFASQAGQIFQIAQMAEGGVKGFAMEVGGLLLRFTPLIAVTSVAAVALYRWKEQINDDAGLKKFADGLGLTHKEMKKLGDTSVTTGDLVAGVWKTISDGAGIGGSGKSIMDYLFSPDDAKQVQGFMASIYGTFVGGYDAIVELWGRISSVVSGYVSAAAAAAGKFFAPVIAAAQWAGNAIGQIFSSIYNWAAGWLKSIGGAVAPVLSAMGLPAAAAAIANAGSSLGKTFGNAYSKRVEGFVSTTNAVVAKAAANTVDAAQQRLKKKADELKADRTPKKEKADTHAEQLARDAAAVEAQIKNLYALANAYGVSGAAALIAEARVKAESAAIKQRGDIEAAVERQVRLAIAQRVSDAGKSTAASREQALAQEQVNAMVAAGLVPAERAADLVRDRIADLRLLEAIEAAQKVNDLKGLKEARQALEDQRAARERLTKAEADARYNSAMAVGGNRLAELREELRLLGATEQVRARALAELRATQEVSTWTAGTISPEKAAAYVKLQGDIAAQAAINAQAQDAYNDALTFTADQWDLIASNVQNAARGMSDAFGEVGRSIGDLASTYAGYNADRARLDAAHNAQLKKYAGNQAALAQENKKYALATSTAQIGAYGDMAEAAQGFFKKGSTGYKALGAAEKAFRAIQLAMSIQSMVQNALETAGVVTNAAVKATAEGTAGIAKQSQLPFPFNIAAMAATAAALVAAGVSVLGSIGGSSKNTLTPANDGSGTILGDPKAQSESIKNAISTLKEVDDATLTVSRDMLASLRSIESNISGLATLLVRNGDISADSKVAQGFKTNAIGSVLSNIPVIGGILGGLFGTKTSVIGSGLYGGSQSVGDILGDGFDASYYSDIKKKKKFFGLTTSTKYSTKYTDADADIEAQFALLIKQFYDTIGQAAGPLGQSLDAVQGKLLGFTVNIGKIDLKGLTGEEIEEKLSAVFGAAADQMAAAAVPGLDRFQQVGEGTFETLVRVSSTVEQVDASMQKLGATTSSLGIDVDMAIAGMFDSVSDFTNLADTYFEDFFTKQEQAAATTVRLTQAFAGLGLTMPDTLANFRALVEAQNLTTDAGRSTYVALLQLAPAFSNLKTSLEDAKSAADILSERQDLEMKLLQLTGDTTALRAAELAKIDPSNRALQQQIYAIQDAQDAAKAAQDLANAWSTVGDSIMDEVKRIRGLTDASTGGSFASIMGQFNASTASAVGGDQDAAKSLPGLSQALLTAAADAATSRQELDRIRAQTAASLEATYGAILSRTNAASASAADTLAAAAASSQAPAAGTAANDDMAAELRALRGELAQLRSDTTAGLATVASNTGRAARTLEDVTSASGGEAISVASAA